ncbi:MAG TPA: type II toxin-antitoxin system VapC family toxin [Solirubrobacteraceae bacterium]|nr:type II toxin-antitoxin system VapC family toxin [Solirubrobacteraceae bacterium]
MLVVDASVAVAACHTPMGFANLRGHELVAPQLMLVEASSVLHEMAWREEITKPRAEIMLDRLLKAPVKVRTPSGLVRTAWRVADELGWAKTYDAQYSALALHVSGPSPLFVRIARGRYVLA